MKPVTFESTDDSGTIELDPVWGEVKYLPPTSFTAEDSFDEESEEAED